MYMGSPIFPGHLVLCTEVTEKKEGSNKGGGERLFGKETNHTMRKVGRGGGEKGGGGEIYQHAKKCPRRGQLIHAGKRGGKKKREGPTKKAVNQRLTG